MSRVPMMKTAICALAIAIACASAVPAGAQSSYSSSGGPTTELTIFNGYYIASDLYSSTGDLAGATIGLENSYMWGAKLGVNPNDRVGIELPTPAPAPISPTLGRASRASMRSAGST